MWKKILLIFFAAILIFAFAACNEEPAPEILDNSGETGGGEGNEEPKDETVLDISANDFVIIFPEQNRKHENIAKDFKSQLKSLTGVDLPVKGESAKKAEHEIQFGALKSRDEAKNILRRLDLKVTDISAAYSISVDGNVIIVTATSNTALEMAKDELLTYIQDGKLVLSRDFEKSYIVYQNGEETVKLDTAAFEANTSLISIAVGAEKLVGFSMDTKNYSAVFPSTSSYPEIYAVSLNPKASVSVTAPEDNGGTAKITVKSENGTSEDVYTLKFDFADSTEVVSEIVNKNAVDGVVSFIFDDGDKQTADIISSRLLPKYDSVVLSYALITNTLATTDGTKDAAGNYKLTPVPYKSYNSLSDSVFAGTYQYNYEFWLDAVAVRKGIELISHSYSHDGPLIVENPYLELKLSQETLQRFCNQRAYTYVNPGVGVYAQDETYNDLRVNSGIYIGARGGSATLTTAPWLRQNYENRYMIGALATMRSQYLDKDGKPTTDASATKEGCLAEGISKWTDYIDSAVSENSLATFCIHTVVPKDMPRINGEGKWDIYEEQLDALFAHAEKLSDEGKLWIANYTDAQLYYNQWASAVLKTTVKKDSSVTLSLTIPEDEENRELYTMEMTVKVPIPTTWESAVSGESTYEIVKCDDGTQFVYVNIAPNTELTLTEN